MRKTYLTSFNNSWYKPGPRLKILLWYFFNVAFLKNYLNPSSTIKIILLRAFGAKIGKGVLIKPRVNVKYPWNLEIGNHVWIGEGVWIDNLGMVRIEDNVCISQGALLLCGNHNYKKSTFDLMVGNITLEEGVWIGAKSTVCPGINCYSHSILCINSVASTHLKPYSIYRGNPAVKIKERAID